ncbi:MAG: hypothetical protein ABIF10_01265 [Candidatus Woesearchaeota archaeon]
MRINENILTTSQHLGALSLEKKFWKAASILAQSSRPTVQYNTHMMHIS